MDMDKEDRKAFTSLAIFGVFAVAVIILLIVTAVI